MTLCEDCKKTECACVKTPAALQDVTNAVNKVFGLTGPMNFTRASATGKRRRSTIYESEHMTEVNQQHQRLLELIEQLDTATAIRDEADAHRDALAKQIHDTRESIEMRILEKEIIEDAA